MGQTLGDPRHQGQCMSRIERSGEQVGPLRSARMMEELHERGLMKQGLVLVALVEEALNRG